MSDEVVSFEGDAIDQAFSRNPNCSPIQLAMFDGQEIDKTVFAIKGGELDSHDFDGPIKMGREFGAEVRVRVVEVKASKDKKGNLVRKHTLEVLGLRCVEGGNG